MEFNLWSCNGRVSGDFWERAGVGWRWPRSEASQHSSQFTLFHSSHYARRTFITLSVLILTKRHLSVSSDRNAGSASSMRDTCNRPARLIFPFFSSSRICSSACSFSTDLASLPRRCVVARQADVPPRRRRGDPRARYDGVPVRCCVERSSITNAESDKKYPTNAEQLSDVFWQACVGSCSAEEYDALKAKYEAFARTIRLFQTSARLRVDRLRALSNITLALTTLDFAARLLRGKSRPTDEDWIYCSQAMGNRRMVTTARGYIGLVPRIAQCGDFIALFEGGSVPLVVRPVRGKWKLLGESYMHGIMRGEAFDESRSETMWIE